MGLMSTSSILWAGLTLHGQRGDGSVWRTLQLNGWDALSNRRDRQSRSQQAGSFPSTAYRSSVTIEAAGEALFTDPVMAKLAMLELKAAARDADAEFTVTNAAGTFTRVVEVDDIADPNWVNDRHVEWALKVTPCDPLLYGPMWLDTTTLAGAVAGAGRTWPRAWPRDWGTPEGVTPGSVAVPNAGLAPYWTTARIDGPVTNPVVRCVETGDWVRINADIPSGQWIDLDLGERHVTVGANADDVRYLVDASGTWLAVPPGGATYTLEADSGSPDTTLTVTGREGAWE